MRPGHIFEHVNKFEHSCSVQKDLIIIYYEKATGILPGLALCPHRQWVPGIWSECVKIQNGKNVSILQYISHDDVIKWYFPRYWPFVRGIHRSPENSPHKGQWRGALMFPLICVRINGWVNNREAGDLRRHRAHYDVIVMPQRPYSPEQAECRTAISGTEWILRFRNWDASYDILSHVTLRYIITGNSDHTRW